jgi:hypothetical protein
MSERICNVLFSRAGSGAGSMLAESILRKDGRQDFRTDRASSGRDKAD